MNQDTELFSGVDNAMIAGDYLPKLGAGNYTVRVDKTTIVTSTRPETKGVKFAVTEVTVLGADEGSQTPANTQASIGLSSRSVAFDKNVKGLVMAATGASAEKITKQEAAAFFSEAKQSKVRGATFKVRVTPAVSKAGHAFSKLTFSPVESNQ